ncbi:hypothetical protein M3Y98_00253200 [Aphelenchoides besseyi]|nr:hypothetical protein M3Y98_00253200 [Aphelenchoides besseyi]KAI6200791.1 hypothetical protein M3Y96_00771900 [Aphelenchoides besseyi]
MVHRPTTKSNAVKPEDLKMNNSSRRKRPAEVRPHPSHCLNKKFWDDVRAGRISNPNSDEKPTTSKTSSSSQNHTPSGQNHIRPNATNISTQPTAVVETTNQLHDVVSRIPLMTPIPLMPPHPFWWSFTPNPWFQFNDWNRNGPQKIPSRMTQNRHPLSFSTPTSSDLAVDEVANSMVSRNRSNRAVQFVPIFIPLTTDFVQKHFGR